VESQRQKICFRCCTKKFVKRPAKAASTGFINWRCWLSHIRKGDHAMGLEILADGDDFPFLMTTMIFMRSIKLRFVENLTP
jgi:hypothetical protein